MSGIWGEVQEFFSEERMSKMNESEAWAETEKEYSYRPTKFRRLKQEIRSAIQEATVQGKRFFTLRCKKNDSFSLFFFSCAFKISQHTPSGEDILLTISSPGTMVDGWKNLFSLDFQWNPVFDPCVYIWLRILYGKLHPFHIQMSKTYFGMRVTNTHSGTIFRFFEKDSELASEDMKFSRRKLESRFNRADKYIQEMLNTE